MLTVKVGGSFLLNDFGRTFGYGFEFFLIISEALDKVLIFLNIFQNLQSRLMFIFQTFYQFSGSRLYVFGLEVVKESELGLCL